MNVLSASPYFPLSGFHRMAINLRQGGRPEVLFLPLKSPIDPVGRAEVWPLVKALDQFGTLSRVKSLDRDCHDITQHVGKASRTGKLCQIPSFDLSHALYRSDYLRLSVGQLVTVHPAKLRPNRRLSRTEQQVFERYACQGQSPGCRNPDGSVQLPLIAVGNYVQTVSQIILPAEFSAPVATEGTPGPDWMESIFSFDALHQAMLLGKDPTYGTRVVEDINAEANIMTALVCHADGRKPMSVCTRAAIGQILRHVK